jgi:hypothetical protein
MTQLIEAISRPLNTDRIYIKVKKFLTSLALKSITVFPGVMLTEIFSYKQKLTAVSTVGGTVYKSVSATMAE